jgi:hypothetical protein
MKKKHEDLKEKNLFYCFVELDDDPRVSPTSYILPSIVVAETLEAAHSIWLHTPGSKGQPHKDTDMRRFLPDYSRTLKGDHPFIKEHGEGWLDQYRESWNIFG